MGRVGPLGGRTEPASSRFGSKLVYEGLDTLNEFGYAAVVVLGAPLYYRRFGFKPASDHRLYCRWLGTEAEFQVYPLAADALQDVDGLVTYSTPFNRF